MEQAEKTVARKLRLSRMRLSGFKSFVDPTVVEFPSNLVAIVGPNGCGKSNLIDAVLWVMGESSAKNLRGESMADVIFNGSNQRKPLGQASIELYFDNPQGALGGEYANYPEIVIRREVTRDGQSDYYINNTRCRRRDIIDIFLGTGLGPRSYSIISQGTISRLVEAKPEELRSYLEEAAGISKYKERRRETENRMGHTRENLDRLLDLREELARQLDHLEKQAESARRYTELKTEERLYHSQLLAIRWQNLSTQIEVGSKQIQDYEVNLEAQLAKLQKTDTQIELLRESQHEAQERFNDAQEIFYELGSQVTQIEQTIKFQHEKLAQYERDLAQVSSDKENNEKLFKEDHNRIEQLQTQRVNIEPELAEISSTWTNLNEKLNLKEKEYQAWLTQWDNFNAEISEKNRIAQVEQTRIQHLESAITATKARLEKLQNEFSHLNSEPIQVEIKQLKEQVCECQLQLDEKQKILQTSQQSIQPAREKIKQLESYLNERRSKLQQTRGRLSSLEALQQSAMGKQNSQLLDWIKQHRLDNKPNLASLLDVENGWEIAVETVLGAHLQAICIDSLDCLTSAFSTLGKQNIALLETSNNDLTQESPSQTLLSSKIKSKLSISSILQGIYIADNLNVALLQRKTLKENESIVTRDGYWIGTNWLLAKNDKDPTRGTLQREAEIRELKQDIENLELDISENENKLLEARGLLSKAESEKDTNQSDLQQKSKQLSEAQAQLRIREMRYDQALQRQKQLNNDMEEGKEQLNKSASELERTRQTWNEAMALMGDYTQQKERLQNSKIHLQHELDGFKHQVSELREVRHQKSLQAQTLDAEIKYKKEQLERLNLQTNTLSTRYAQLQQIRVDTQLPIAGYERELTNCLEKRHQAEESLNEAKILLQTREHELREQEHSRQSSQRDVDLVKSQLESNRMEMQIYLTKSSTLEEQLTSEQCNLQDIIQALPADATEIVWEQQLQRILNRISRLGAINLAAIDEYAAQLERKTYLDEQHEDLTQALQTLEEAIRKIDKETRHRFRETFDFVNQHFQKLFPKIFGGGNAMLEMTGEDLLDTGVSVMARPPGKKNSTIHLLSGGEKALTAIALVFAIFQLNPAPFCMLDEVDAPLDDANVVRYSQLVKEMSSEVQFIFISHNKVAMEIAEQLIGVTMKEPGVSRLVTVNIEEAINLAET